MSETTQSPTIEQDDISFCKARFTTEFIQLKKQYEAYHDSPVNHPMYEKEWKIFYLRQNADLLASKKL